MKPFFLFLLLLPCVTVSGLAYSASAYAVLDADTGVLLDSANADTQLPMASTTKIMTGLLAAEDADPDRTITVPAECAGVEGSSMYLQAGEELTLRDVLYGLMLCSGNDAAECIAAVCGGREEFIAHMNQRAQELGLNHTHFDNPSGLDGETHYTTASELAQLAAYALHNELFAEVVSTSSYHVGTHYMNNHNKLLTRYDGCIGVKTGYTQSSGRCLVSAATREGRTVVAVTLNDGDDWNDHTAMLDQAFSTLHILPVTDTTQPMCTLPVICGQTDQVSLVCSEPLSVSLLGDETADITLTHRGMLYAPVAAGTVCGTVTVRVGKTILASCDLVTSESVPLDETQERKSWWTKIKEAIF